MLSVFLLTHVEIKLASKGAGGNRNMEIGMEIDLWDCHDLALF